MTSFKKPSFLHVEFLPASPEIVPVPAVPGILATGPNMREIVQQLLPEAIAGNKAHPGPSKSFQDVNLYLERFIDIGLAVAEVGLTLIINQ